MRQKDALVLKRSIQSCCKTDFTRVFEQGKGEIRPELRSINDPLVNKGVFLVNGYARGPK